MEQTKTPDSPLVYPVDYFDEASAYNAERTEDPSRGTGSNKVDLRTVEEVDRDGNLRSISDGNPNDFRVLTKDKSDYCLTVDRLVWIDGWRNSSGTQDNEEGMTLLVLNLTFENKRGKNRIASAIAELVFLSEDYGSENPEVVAWGPFRHEERWNPSTAELKTNDKGGVQLAAGISGQQVSLSREHGKEMTNQVINFDQGRATRFYSAPKSQKKPGDKPNGVRWQLKQNDLQGQGVSPELRIAVLVSRPNPTRPYRASFRLEADTGTKENLRNMAQRCSSQTIGDQINWLTNPSDSKENHGGGVHIAKMIDRQNLGSLIKDPSDSENLDQPWLKPWKQVDLVQLVQASQSGAEMEPTGGSKISGDGREVDVGDFVETGAEVHFGHVYGSSNGGRTEKSNEPRDHLPSVAVSGDSEAAGAEKAPPTTTSGNKRHSTRESAKSSPEPRYREDTNCNCQLAHRTYNEYDRLLGLETRAAQAEARLASQDQIIFHLQKEMAFLQKTISSNSSSA